MSSTLPDQYGAGIGQPGLNAFDGDWIRVKFAKAVSWNTEVAARDLEDAETPSISGKIERAGIMAPYGFAQVGTGTTHAGRGLSTYNGLVVSMSGTKWARWNDTNWLTLGGNPTVTAIRINSLVMDGKLIGSSDTVRLQYWDGVDGNPVANLSADAPIGRFIAPIGNRLFAAYVDGDPYTVSWSVDGDITDWTTATLGAGSVVLLPEGRTNMTDNITGLSTSEQGALLYRQRSIMIGTRTGLGAQPFRFTTPIFTVGTIFSYSIANVGRQLGDIFLGSDLNVYLFGGSSLPVPIGDPIWSDLKANFDGLTAEQVTAFYDPNTALYWLCTGINAWVFDVRAFITERRLVWYKRAVSVESTPGFTTVGSFTQSGATLTRPLAGTSSKVWYETGTVGEALSFVTKEFGSLERYSRLALGYISYRLRSGTTATVQLYISTDGGYTYSLFTTLSLTSVGGGLQTNVAPFSCNKVVQACQFKLVLTSGNPVLTEFNLQKYDAGPAAT